MHFGLSGITGSRVRGLGGEWVGCEGAGLVLLAVGDVRQERFGEEIGRKQEDASACGAAGRRPSDSGS